MAVSDLTGYTWTASALTDASIIAAIGTYDLAGNWQFDQQQGSFNGDFTQIKLYTVSMQQDVLTMIELYSAGEWQTAVWSYSSWNGATPVTVQIDGGTDVTNPTLIAFFEANGELTPPAGNTYSLSNSLSNASAEDITFIIQPDEGYALPDTVTVTNGTLVSYDKTTGEVVVSGASAEISVECEAVAPSGYTVSISTTGDSVGTAFDVYDGIYPSGTRLGDLDGSDVTPIDFTITSGNISFVSTGSDESIVSYSSTGGISNFVVYPNVQCDLKADVSGNGTITLQLYQD